MQRFRDLAIANKLLVVFAAIFLTAGFMGWSGIHGLSIVNGSTKQLSGDSIPELKLIAEMRLSVANVNRAVLDHLLCDSPACERKFEQIEAQGRQRLSTAVTSYSALSLSPSRRELFEKSSATCSAFVALSEEVIQQSRSGHKAEASHRMLDEGLSGYETAKKASQANTDAISAEATETSKSADSIYRGARITVVFALVGMLALCLLAAKALTDALSKPLVKAAAMLERVAAKDLTKQLDITGHDEVGQLSASLNRTIANMRDMLSQISDGTSTLVTATEEVTVSSHRASDNAQQQSMSVQMVATAAQELSSVISEISQNTSSASHASRTSAEDAHNGGRIVAATVQSIQSISSSSDSVLTKMAALRSRSEQIGSVVSVIREIADQTNLLALNASIESARAGEMGRGFAVVAGEVRRLAERTRTSTDEIGSLIDGIQGEVRDAFSAAEHGRADVATGLEHARQAGEALEKIIASARDAEGMVHLIAAAATEQASASAEISSNMGSISSSIEDSAAAAQQSSKTCKDLSHLAANLRLTVSEFSLS